MPFAELEVVFGLVNMAGAVVQDAELSLLLLDYIPRLHCVDDSKYGFTRVIVRPFHEDSKFIKLSMSLTSAPAYVAADHP